MSELAQRIRTLHEHAGRILREREQLAKANAALQEELREQERNNDVLHARIMELEKENEVLRAVNTPPMVVDRPGSKERIDELVSEIDRCLALLTT